MTLREMQNTAWYKRIFSSPESQWDILFKRRERTLNFLITRDILLIVGNLGLVMIFTFNVSEIFGCIFCIPLCYFWYRFLARWVNQNHPLHFTKNDYNK